MKKLAIEDKAHKITHSIEWEGLSILNILSSLLNNRSSSFAENKSKIVAAPYDFLLLLKILN